MNKKAKCSQTNIIHIFWIIPFKMSRFNVVFILSNLTRLTAIYFCCMLVTLRHTLLLFSECIYFQKQIKLVNIFLEFVVSNRIDSPKQKLFDPSNKSKVNKYQFDQFRCDTGIINFRMYIFISDSWYDQSFTDQKLIFG